MDKRKRIKVGQRVQSGTATGTVIAVDRTPGVNSRGYTLPEAERVFVLWDTYGVELDDA